MPTTLVRHCIENVSTQLRDTANIHWKKDELLSWFNDARKEVISKRPDSYPNNRIHVCAAAAKQTLPDDSVRLLDVVGNKDGGGITPINQDVLDVRIPGWLASPFTSNVKHFVYRDVNPKNFYLYPRPNAGHLINIIVSRIPNNTVIQNYNTDSQTILIDDSFSNALQYYMLYRAWSKDADHANNVALASQHMQLFLQTVGDTTNADASTSPT